MEGIKVEIIPTDKEHILNMNISDPNKFIDNVISNIMSNLSDIKLEDYSIVNNNELYEQILLRVIVDLFIKNKKDMKKDFTYTVICNYNGDNYRLTIRDVAEGDNVGIKGIVYGLSIY